LGVERVAAGEVPERPLHALRGLLQALARHVLAQAGDELGDQRLEARLAHLVEVVKASEVQCGFAHGAVMVAHVTVRYPSWLTIALAVSTQLAWAPDPAPAGARATLVGVRLDRLDSYLTRFEATVVAASAAEAG